MNSPPCRAAAAPYVADVRQLPENIETTPVNELTKTR
jgi:hypothetical protein